MLLTGRESQFERKKTSPVKQRKVKTDMSPKRQTKTTAQSIGSEI